FKNTGFNSNRQFNCRFGDIKRIEAIGSSRAVITLKNNEEIEVKGSGDVGATVYVLDEDRGEIKVRWKHLETVEFLETPKKLNRSFGLLLSGVVKTESGTFEGLVQWDTDECLDYDELNGEDEDGSKIDLRFERIESIEKRNRRSAIVKLFTGKQYLISGSNDVNSENRGILIFDKRFGQVEVAWDEFIEVKFNKASTYTGMAYTDFEVPEKLKGKVTTDKEAISGRIVFDLDETFKSDILNGKMDDISYSIPFALVKRIERNNRHAATVELKSGKILELYDSTDVDESNQGILVFESNNKPIYQPWNAIRSIEF
ncbi:MAG: hypothetical protein KDD94_13600, partial [Calditrichaeota bacterium]|nr:hypothetical protein [Calditrichota bacterium]